MPDSGDYDELFDDESGVTTCRELQALALFLIREKKAGVMRNKIEGFSIPSPPYQKKIDKVGPGVIC